jgi:hypothetical protein
MTQSWILLAGSILMVSLDHDSELGEGVPSQIGRVARMIIDCDHVDEYS